MSEPADLSDLGEYFPGVVPRLVASLWAPALEDAFNIQVIDQGGHLFATGDFSLRPSMPPEPESAEAAASYWREYVEPELERQAAEIGAVDPTDSESAARDLMRRWLEFFHWYFLNPAVGWIERARDMAENQSDLVGRGFRVRRRQRLLSEISAARQRNGTESVVADRLLLEYLDEFGAYSAHPECLVGPFPRDDHSLIERELDLIGRRPAVGDALSEIPEVNSAAGWPDLLAIAEDDNHYKYETCYAAHTLIVAIGGALVQAGVLGAQADVWNLSMDELIGQTKTGTAAAPGQLPDPVRRRAQRDARGPFVVAGHQVVGGAADGFAWTASGDSDMPDGDVVLMSEGLGSIQAGSLLPYVRGLVARHGGPTSHCALIAREVNCPVVVVGSGLDDLRDGDHLILQEGGTIVVEPRPADGGHDAAR